MKKEEYKQWLVEQKTKIHKSRLKVALQVNEELLRLFWGIGHDIVVNKMEVTLGSIFFERLSKDLKSEIPMQIGLSEQNLHLMKQFYLFYKQLGTESETHSVFQIPWSYHILILTKCKSTQEAMFYVQKTVEEGWSITVLLNSLDVNLYKIQEKTQQN